MKWWALSSSRCLLGCRLARSALVLDGGWKPLVNDLEHSEAIANTATLLINAAEQVIRLLMVGQTLKG